MSAKPTDARKRWLRRGAVLLGFIATVTILRAFIGGFLVVGESMEPTLLHGDWLLVRRVLPEIGRLTMERRGETAFRRFEVVVLRRDRGKSDVKLAKRIVGRPGDVLLMEHSVLYVNGRRIEEPYAMASEEHANEATLAMLWQLEHLHADADHRRYFPTKGNWGPLLVPQGQYFVLGDNRDNSIDSREMGFVAANDILARVGRVLLSHDRSCCNAAAIFRGIRSERIGLSVNPLPGAP